MLRDRHGVCRIEEGWDTAGRAVPERESGKRRKIGSERMGGGREEWEKRDR